MTNPPQIRRRTRAAVLATAIILFGACGGDPTTDGSASTVSELTDSEADMAVVDSTASESAAETATPSDAIATASAPGIAPSASTPSTVAPAATPPPTTAAPLPTPALIPLDDESSEPVVELGSIVIPAIGIDRPLFEGIRLPTFDRGPGHWPGTAMPGQLGNVVVGGHRTESHADFGDLDLLQPGDEVIFNDTSGAAVTYVVTSTEIVDPFAAVIVNQTRAYTATLFACHPKRSTDQRIVVRLELVG